MKRMKRRLFLHFTLQYVSLAVALMIMFFLILLILIIKVTNDEAEFNYYQTTVNTVAMDTDFGINQLKMVDDWDKNFSKDEFWVQIINSNGKVVDSSQVPEELPNRYTQHELYTMKQTDEFLGYSLYFYLETTYPHPYLFVLGTRNDEKGLLEQLVTDYGTNGTVEPTQIQALTKQIEGVNGYLEIISPTDQLLQKVGTPPNEQLEPLDMVVRSFYPDLYETKTAIGTNPVTNDLWVLHTPNTQKKDVELSSLQDIIMAIAISVGIMLVITIGISIWNGFRYGNPLFIFANWLSRMGNGQYEEVLTEKEKKHIFRKNGKIRLRYRLYTEVFQAFYEMAEKLNASNKERETLERTRDEWMSGISHDLRTPLASMQGYGTLLESGHYDWSREELIDIGKTIDEKSQYMLRLIEDFSLHFQLKNQSLQAHKEVVELHSFIRDVLKKYEDDLTLDEYSFTLIPLHRSFSYPVAGRWFERMLDNIIANAITHNPAGTAITITLGLNERELVIVVADNGMGMDAETVSNMFTRYYRGTSTDARTEGSGLGMSIALQIAEFHQGTITVVSEVGQGTKVTLTFPIH